MALGETAFPHFDAGRLGPGTQRGSHRISQESPWLCEGQKSHMSQQDVKAEFVEDIYIQMDCLGDPTRKGESLVLLRVWGHHRGW